MYCICVLGVSWYTGIDDNRDIQSNNYRYRVNLMCDDIPLLAITAIFKTNRTLNTTCKYNQYLVDLQVTVLRLNSDTVKQEEEQLLREELCSSA